MRLFKDQPYEIKDNGEISFSDYLAVERTRLANERTLLSYIRSSLYLFISAIALFQLEGLDQIKWLAWPCIVFSLLSLAAGTIRYHHLKKRLAQSLKKGVRNKS
jgi:putative membrane protein